MWLTNGTWIRSRIQAKHAVIVELGGDKLDGDLLIIIRNKPGRIAASLILDELGFVFDIRGLSATSLRRQAISIPSLPDAELDLAIEILTVLGWTVQNRTINTNQEK
jgi:hypothetical protein